MADRRLRFRPALIASAGGFSGERYRIRSEFQRATRCWNSDRRRAGTASRLESDGVLWLRQRPTEAAQKDALDLQVFRLLTDGIPFEITTRLELRVSGQAREETLGPVLLPDFCRWRWIAPCPPDWSRTDGCECN